MMGGMGAGITRRSFLKGTAATVAAGFLSRFGLPADLPAQNRTASPLPRRRLGATGEEVSILGLGGAIAVAGDRARAEAIVDRALDLGVNYIDTAAQYGPSEENIGSVMRRRRAEVFLASKTHDSGYDGTMRLFERSLRRLQTDYLDLYQIHGLHSDSMLQAVRGEAGALKALERLKAEGAVRYLGVSAHKNAELIPRVLESFPFDCALISLNAGDRHIDSMIEYALPAARRRRLGIIAMKVAAYDGRIFREGGVASMEEALGYVLSHPVSTAIVGIGSIAQLEQNAAIAREFRPFSRTLMREIEERTASYHEEINFFKHLW